MRIDFDALSEAGLFLLSGPTGAGKSSVLDAVCFALYGDVPGDRSAAKRLRSDHAADDVAPRVVLEATLSGRRFRIDRSPAWIRPKKRGSGTTTEQARVAISERRPTADGPDAWHPLSTRLDETGHLVTRLVGMTLPQFCQVAMLPQGRFQAFLRARSYERHTLLQQVFQTERFDRAERWLRDRRVELRRSAQAHQHAVSDLVSRVSEVAGDPAPHDWASDPDALHEWLAELLAATDRAATAQAAEVSAATTAEEAAEQASTDGIALAGLRATYAAARRDRDTLEAGARDHQARRERVETARRAAAVRPLHDLAVEAEAHADALAVRSDATCDALGRLLGEDALDDQQIAEHGRTATRTLGELARVRPLRQQVHDLERQLSRAARAQEEAAGEVSRSEARAAEIPALLEQLAPELASAREAAAQAQALQGDLVVLDTRLRAARSADTLADRVLAAERALAEAVEARLVAREALVQIREQRLDGMAAEIAGRLAVGGCCPVCGSAEHPSPASAAPGAPDEAAERDARREVDDLEVVVEAHGQQLRGLEAQLAAARTEAGAPVDRLLDAQEDTRARLEAAAAEAATLEVRAARVDALRAELDEVSRLRETLAATAAQHATEAAVLASRLDDVREQVAAVVPPDADPEALTAFHQQVERLAEQHATVTADLDRARTTAASTRQAADDVAAGAGFASSADAASAWLPADDVEALRQEVERHERELARLDELLADPALVHAAATEAPDLEALARAHHRARADAAAARQADARLRERVRRLRGLTQEVEQALAQWLPARAELDLVADLSSLVEGKHPDNRFQMRLSAYVLAHRLGQVVEAANVRLSTMSDQRYSLVHTGRRGAGETRGGLSLLVRDDWTGDTRDPATLSGGETFVVSLALALGLADVITQEVGGTDLDTLFVDEGFGSLDSETLEDVMDTLDTLRDGGRVVGVVSHVPELQTRIPAQLRVHRGRQGSSATLRLG
ncbi:AAA family ATPase [Nocardioides sp. SYSU D00065]|uniref:AAA family ATPase n=1 Tax=Nocardioides sp. SYSU D00065 TaxID=2817378 RepID=UPI0035ABA297